MSDLESFFAKKKTSKNKKNKVDLDSLGKRLEKTVLRQQQEEAEREQLEEEQKRDEDYIKSQMQVDDDWDDGHGDDQIMPNKLISMNAGSDEDVLSSANNAQAEVTEGGIMVGAETDEQSEAMAAEAAKAIVPNKNAWGISNNENVNPQTTEVKEPAPVAPKAPSVYRGPAQRIKGPELDSEMLFPSLGAADDIEKRQREEDKRREAERDLRLKKEAERAKQYEANVARLSADRAASDNKPRVTIAAQPALSEAERHARFEREQAERARKQEELKAEILASKETEIQRRQPPSEREITRGPPMVAPAAAAGMTMARQPVISEPNWGERVAAPAAQQRMTTNSPMTRGMPAPSAMRQNSPWSSGNTFGGKPDGASAPSEQWSRNVQRPGAAASAPHASKPATAPLPTNSRADALAK